MFLPLATVRNNAFYYVLVTVKMTKGSSSGGSADEGRDTISVKRDEYIVESILSNRGEWKKLTSMALMIPQPTLAFGVMLRANWYLRN